MNGEVTLLDSVQPAEADPPSAGVLARLRRWARRKGITAIEYCFMLSFIFLAVLVAVQYLGSSLKTSFENSNDKMQQTFPF